MNELLKSFSIRRPLGWILTLGALSAVPLLAAPVEVATGISADRLAPATLDDLESLGLSVQDEQVELSLQDAVAIALQRNLSIDVERFRRSQSRLGIAEAMGIYDLNLESSFAIDSDSSPTSSSLQVVEGGLLTNRATVWNTALSQLTPWGGTARIDFDNTRFSTSDQTARQNPRFSVGFDLTVTQPLLRNFGRTTTEQNLILARNNSASSREAFQTQVETVVSQVVSTYWALVEARLLLKVANESLELAKELDSMNRIQVEVGTLAPLELVQSEAGVAAREESIIRQQALVEDNADSLRQLLNIDSGDLWNIGLVPVTPPEIEHEAIDLNAAVQTAMEVRPDLRRQRLANQNLEVRADVARNQKRPRLDLQGRWGYNAIAGDIRNADDSITESDYGDALSDILDRDFKGWQVALNFAYPLQNRTARAQSAAADLALEEGNFTLRQLEQQVLTEVRRAARAVETAAKQIESAKVSSKLERKNLDAQRKRYENGLATSFQVLQIQEDLSEAASREVSAIISYRNALNQFQQAIGMLLEENEIELDDSGE